MRVAFQDVRYRYPTGEQALRGVTLAIPPGQAVAIIGHNGAGKTTLVRHLNGIYAPSSGSVEVGGRSTAGRDIAELSREVGYVFQNPGEQLFARTVREEVAFGPANLGLDVRRREQLTEAAMAATGITAMAGAHPYHLSFAERKRVALACVLAMDTPVVVLDEPTTGQDARGTEMIMSVLDRLKSEGRTVIAVTHDMDLAAGHFERVVVMAGGTVIADGGPREVFADAAALARAQVEPPQLAQLAARLGWQSVPLTAGEFAAAYRSR